MLYTYEWVDGWIDKQTVKLCCKLHSTRRVYNLDLIKLILKNTTDIIFSWAVAVGLLSPWKTDCFQSTVFLQYVQGWKCFCSAPWLDIICSSKLSLMRWKGRGGVLKPLLPSVAHTSSPLQLHEMSPVQRTATYIWDSAAKIQAFRGAV